MCLFVVIFLSVCVSVCACVCLCVFILFLSFCFFLYFGVSKIVFLCVIEFVYVCVCVCFCVRVFVFVCVHVYLCMPIVRRKMGQCPLGAPMPLGAAPESTGITPEKTPPTARHIWAKSKNDVWANSDNGKEMIAGGFLILGRRLGHLHRIAHVKLKTHVTGSLSKGSSVQT